MAVLREALSALPSGAPEALETLLVRAHALKGTAASFGASAVAASAGALERRAREWTQHGIREDELPAAVDELARLSREVAVYRDLGSVDRPA